MFSLFNTSVFVGYKVRGLRGAATALLGVVLPSFVILLAIALFFADVRHNPVVDAAFKGMRPAVVALIAAPVFGLARGMGWWKIGLAAIAALIVWLLGVSPIWFILVGAVGGILYTFYNRKGAPGTGKGTRS